ncbi:hypothetical protein TrLO_g3972 [Triparma laevis f. longispina]|uniref:Uncharacterized protein n=1 Tax=Triparma laevis f. longispina TaxID=1714387 RepID=A0A9W6Z8T7_9STRA|nr:hypothetical protein TrLO_g3972 [Triparma laevis f. longispina]
MLSTLNYSLLLRVTKSFNFLLLFGYLTTATVALCVSFRDERIIGMLSAYLGFIVLMLGDALPDKIRREGALFGSIAILILTIRICYALFQEKIPDLYLSSVSMGKMSYTTADIAFLACFNIIFFLTNYIYNNFLQPECYVILASSMKSIKVEERKANILTTVNQRLDIPSGSARNKTRLGPLNHLLTGLARILTTPDNQSSSEVDDLEKSILSVTHTEQTTQQK